jgi:capsular polysaccharide biosynthesis protein
MVLITVTLVTFILPESFSSVARIKIERDDSDIAGLAERKPVTGYDPYFIQTEFELIQSEVILSKVIVDLDLNKAWGKRYANGERLKPSESLALLKGRIDLRPVRNTSIIEIRVYSEQPEEAARIANAVAEAYKDFRVKARAGRISASISALEQAYEDNNQKMRSIRAEMAELARAQSSPDSNRLVEASSRLEELQRFGQVLFTKIATEKTDLSLPATGMVQIVDRAVPGLRPVRPNKPLNIFIGIIIGGVGGLFLATLVYVLQRRAFRRTAGIPRTPFPPRFRAIVHILIALVVGVVVGYRCATPEYFTTMIVVPLTLLLGGIGSAYLELANPHIQTGPAAPQQTDPQDLFPRNK